MKKNQIFMRNFSKHQLLFDFSNCPKDAKIVTDFNEYKDTLFNKKLIRHKMKRIQRKKHNITK